VELIPERAALSPKTRPFTGHAEVLAGESPVDKIDICPTWFSVGDGSLGCDRFSLCVICDSFHANVSDIRHPFHVRPVPFQNCQAVLILFYLHDRLDACPLHPQLEPTNARE